MSATYKKCIVLDLDNTLWGGVVGEEGIAGISLSLSDTGSSFIAFQQGILDLYNRGVILAINSHNNPEDALAVIRNHPNMILKEHHFASMRVNWDDKALNIRSIAEELGIGIDSMVFFDDNPLQRQLVRAALPEVEVPELPQDPQLYTKILHSLPYFPTHIATSEDAMRGNLYVTERLRRAEEQKYDSKEAFLVALGIEVVVSINDTALAPRVAQLTDKTNQFNTNKHPLSEEEVIALMSNNASEILSIRAIDRYGDYGIIGAALVEKASDYWRINQLLMSCRILGRDVENALVSIICERAKHAGIKKLIFDFTQTEKNIPAKKFLDEHVGSAPFIVNLERYISTTPRHITIKTEHEII